MSSCRREGGLFIYFCFYVHMCFLIFRTFFEVPRVSKNAVLNQNSFPSLCFAMVMDQLGMGMLPLREEQMVRGTGYRCKVDPGIWSVVLHGPAPKHYARINS